MKGNFLNMFSLQKTSRNLESVVETNKSCLLTYIRERNWDKLLAELETSREILSPKTKPPELLANPILFFEGFKRRNALHVVCCERPPVRVVMAILDVCPMCVEGIDKNGYTPLHCAAAWGASPQVIACLIHRYPQASAIKDIYGKTPLHLCCESCSFEGACDTGLTSGAKFVRGPLYEVVQALINAAPCNINDEDSDGLTALEYAIHKGANIEVVKALQIASELAWKENKKCTAPRDESKKGLGGTHYQPNFSEESSCVSPNVMTPQTRLLIMKYLQGNMRKRGGEEKRSKYSSAGQCLVRSLTLVHSEHDNKLITNNAA